MKFPIIISSMEEADALAGDIGSLFYEEIGNARRRRNVTFVEAQSTESAVALGAALRRAFERLTETENA